MRIADAREIVELARIDPTTYSFEGESDGGLCVLALGQAWHVFSSERGRRFDEQTFASEDEAAVHFLERLFRLHPPR